MHRTHSAKLKNLWGVGAAILCAVALSFVSCGGSGSGDKDAGLESDADVTTSSPKIPT